MNPVELVVFDIGNVLVRWQPEAYYDAVFSKDLRQRLFEAVDLHGMNEAIDRGEDFQATVQKTADEHPEFAVEIAHWHDQWHRIAAPAIEGSVKTIEALHARGIRLAILSNIGVIPFEIARKAYPFLDLVEVPVLSGAVKISKPEAGIFAHLEGLTGVAPRAILFADDRLENIEAAQARGWQVHHFHSAEAWQSDLKKRGLV